MFTALIGSDFFFCSVFIILEMSVPLHLESKHLVRWLHAPHEGPLVRVDRDEESLEQEVALLEIAELFRDDLKVFFGWHSGDMLLENPFAAHHHIATSKDLWF